LVIDEMDGANPMIAAAVMTQAPMTIQARRVTARAIAANIMPSQITDRSSVGDRERALSAMWQ
jgi:hypothetical protein